MLIITRLKIHEGVQEVLGPIFSEEAQEEVVHEQQIVQQEIVHEPKIIQQAMLGVILPLSPKTRQRLYFDHWHVEPSNRMGVYRVTTSERCLYS